MIRAREDDAIDAVPTRGLERIQRHVDVVPDRVQRSADPTVGREIDDRRRTRERAGDTAQMSHVGRIVDAVTGCGVDTAKFVCLAERTTEDAADRAPRTGDDEARSPVAAQRLEPLKTRKRADPIMLRAFDRQADAARHLPALHVAADDSPTRLDRSRPRLCWRDVDGERPFRQVTNSLLPA